MFTRGQFTHVANGDDLLASETQTLPAIVDELQRQDAHADQVGAVDALKALSDHRADAQQLGALSRPVAGGAGAVFLACKDNHRPAFGPIARGRVKDRHHIARREVAGDAAFDIGRDLVADADVGKGATHHHFMIAAPGTVGIEIALRHLPLGQELTGWGGFADIACRADMVGGDAVAEDGQDPSLDNVGDRIWRHRQALEVGRVLHIG